MIDSVRSHSGRSRVKRRKGSLVGESRSSDTFIMDSHYADSRILGYM